MTRLLAVALGGGAGAVARYLASGWISRWVYPSPFPFGTLAVNAVGSFALGLLVGLVAEPRPWLSPALRLFLSAGFLGAFTTFSTFSVDTLQALRAGEPRIAITNIAVSLGLGLLACWLGLELGGRA